MQKLSVLILFSKSAKEIKNSSAGYQTKEIICSVNCKTFKGFELWLFHSSFSVKEINNCSVNYQTKEIICSIDWKSF